MKPTFIFATVIIFFVFTACSNGETERDAPNHRLPPESTSSSTEPAKQNTNSTATNAFAEKEETGDDRAGEIPEDDVRQTENFQNEEEVFASDLTAVAESHGWSLEEAQAYSAGIEAVGDVADRIAEEHPDILVGSAVGPEPYDPPRLYIKGPADEFVQALVDAASVEILIIDDQPYSNAELEERIVLLNQELLSFGFDNFSVAADIQQEGLLEATVQRTDGAPQTEDEIISLLSESIRNDVRITFIDEPVVTLS
jgi:hypothetical protein